MFLKGRVEQDDNKRKAIVNDIQKYLGKAMYSIPGPGRAASLTAAWPVLANWRVWQQPRPLYRLWIDEHKGAHREDVSHAQGDAAPIRALG